MGSLHGSLLFAPRFLHVLYDELRASNKDFEGKRDLEIIVSGIEWSDSDEDYGDEDYNPYEDELFNLLYDVPESCYDDDEDDE